MENKATEFYTELVLVTIFSLVTANIWVHFIKEIINKYFSNSIILLFGVSLVLTLASILVLSHWFGDKVNTDKEIQKIKDERYYKNTKIHN